MSVVATEPVATTASDITLLGYVAPLASASLTAKQVLLIWEGRTGSLGRAWWTGTYWAIRPWSEVHPTERAALKRKVPRAKPAALPYLGDSDLLALWAVAEHRPTGAATESQRAYLARQGVRIPPALPRLLASETLDLLGLARTAQDVTQQWIGPRPEPGALASALDALRSLSPSTSASDWVAVMAQLARALAPSA